MLIPNDIWDDVPDNMAVWNIAGHKFIKWTLVPTITRSPGGFLAWDIKPKKDDEE